MVFSFFAPVNLLSIGALFLKTYEKSKMEQNFSDKDNRMTSTPILEFDNVTFSAGHIYDSSVSGITFALDPGDLAIVLLEKERVCLPLADLAVGITEPDAGSVKLHGSDWLTMTSEIAAENRGHIGRVFEGNPWLDNLEVSQNIMLGQLHHTHRPIAEITRQAADLSRVFDLPGLPLNLPSTFRGKDLARAACVRAFMGNPDLLILERPTAGVYPELLPSLLNMLNSTRKRGAAVLWLTDNTRIWDNPGTRATLHGRMHGARMHVDRREYQK
jgi:phospholipid/cholesterol/gamma-HCH transport system ATP-binding protein